MDSNNSNGRLVSVPEGPPVISIRGLGKTYEPFPRWMRILMRSQVREPVVALEDVSFDVHAGQICAIVGPNGAGKTTLFRILMGLTSPTAGTASILGGDVSRPSRKVRARVGFSPSDDRSLYLRLTCHENLAFHGRLRGFNERALRRRIEHVLELVGLAEARDRAGFALSSGMRARLQLARAILHKPPVLLLDEPTASVDPLSAHAFLNVLTTLTKEDGLAVMLSSHRLEEIEALHDHVVLLDRGSLLYSGDLDSLRVLWERPTVDIRFSSKRACSRAAGHLKRKGVEIVSAEPHSLSVRTSLDVGPLMTLLDGQLPTVKSVQASRMALRDLLSSVMSHDMEQEGDR